MRLASIVGDSISTFEGCNPDGYAVYYNPGIQQINQLRSVYDTWWAKVNQALGARLCVNNSYSGSRVSGKAFPACGSMERIRNLRTAEYSPDYILIYAGFNDFGDGIEARRTNRRFPFSLSSASFEDAYGTMLKNIRAQYPNAVTVCATLMRTQIRDKSSWVFPEKFAGVPLEDYNDAIRSASQENHCYLADIASSGERCETLDGSHPTAKGHATLAVAWIRCLDSLNLMEPSLETCIRMYHTNKTSDIFVYMVFQALTREKLLLPFRPDGSLAGLQWGDQVILPAFSSPDELRSDEPVRLRAVFLKDNLPLLRSVGKTLIVNPFSQADMQFVIPAAAIDRMFVPILNGQTCPR